MNQNSQLIRVCGDKLTLELEVQIHLENEIYVAVIPALDLATHGDSEDDAHASAVTTAKLFVEEIIKNKTIDDVLNDLGWEKIESENDRESSFVPPKIISRKALLSCHV